MSNIYAVTSREYSYTEWVCAEGGPTYDERDFCYVRAENEQKAKVAAVKAFRQMGAACLSERDECPFTGMKAELVTEAEWLQGIADEHEKVWDFTEAAR